MNNQKEGLAALERLMANYYEMCQDLGNNDDQYQRCNLTSERAIIEKALKENEQYKAIEQELGIDLVTLLKALKGLIYKPTYEKMIKYCGGRYPRYAEGFGLRYNEPTNRYFLSVGSPIDDVWQVLELKDYGKNWALTKKELEK